MNVDVKGAMCSQTLYVLVCGSIPQNRETSARDTGVLSDIGADTGTGLGVRVMPQTFRALRCAECGAFQVHLEGKSPKWSCILCNTKQSLIRVYATGAAKDVRRVVQDLNAARGEAYQSAHAMAHVSGDENRRWQQPPPPRRPQHPQHSWQTSDDDGFATALPDQGERSKQKRVRDEADAPPPPQRHQTVPGLHHGCEQQHQHNGWRSQHDEWHPREDTFHEPYSKPYGEPYGKYGKLSLPAHAHSAGTYHSSHPATHERSERHDERHGERDAGHGRGRSERADVHCFTSAPSEEVEEEVWQG